MRAHGAVLALLVACGAARAQNADKTATLSAVTSSTSRLGLSGIVLDADGKGVRGAVVRAFPLGADEKLPLPQRTHHAVKTDSTGAFYIPVVSGSYELRVERADGDAATAPIYVPKNAGRRVVLRLKRSG